MNEWLVAEFWKNKEVEHTPLLRKWSKLYGPRTYCFGSGEVMWECTWGTVYIHEKQCKSRVTR